MEIERDKKSLDSLVQIFLSLIRLDLQLQEITENP